MRYIRFILLLIPYTIAILIAQGIFFLFNKVTGPLRKYWSAKGRKLQRQLNSEHGTKIRYGECNLY